MCVTVYDKVYDTIYHVVTTYFVCSPDKDITSQKNYET